MAAKKKTKKKCMHAKIGGKRAYICLGSKLHKKIVAAMNAATR